MDFSCFHLLSITLFFLNFMLSHILKPHLLFEYFWYTSKFSENLSKFFIFFKSHITILSSVICTRVSTWLSGHPTKCRPHSRLLSLRDRCSHILNTPSSLLAFKIFFFSLHQPRTRFFVVILMESFFFKFFYKIQSSFSKLQKTILHFCWNSFL